MPLLGLNPNRGIDQYAHDAWTTQHGLPGEAVYQILQTPDGYLWLRTSAGLVRFDGVRFVLMDAVIGSEPVKAIALTPEHDMLLRTFSRTILYRNGVFSDYFPPAPLPDGAVRTLFISSTHEVFVGSDDFAYLIERSGPKMLRRGTGHVDTFLESRTGDVLIAGDHELYHYQAGQFQVVTDKKVMNGNNFLVMIDDHLHRRWAGTWGGVVRLTDAKIPTLEQIAPAAIRGQVHAIFEDRQGNIWVGTDASGLVRLVGDQPTSFISADGLTDNRILSIFEDREGSLWVGTSSGLDRFRDTKVTTLTTKEGLPSEDVRSVLQTRDGSIYVIAVPGGLARIWNDAVIEIPGSKGYPVQGGGVFESRDGSVWFGTTGGLTRFKDGKFTAFGANGRFSSHYLSTIVEDDESLIVATNETLELRFKDGRDQPFTIRGQMTPLSHPGNYTFATYRDPTGTLWFGTVQGLFKFAPGQPPAKARQPQINFAVTSISDDGRGNLWLGGRTPGLIRLRIRDGQVTRFTKKDGLFDDSPNAVLFDDLGNLWISTANGIYMAVRKDLDNFVAGQTVRTTNYGTLDGMKTSEAGPPTQPGGWRASDGRLWFTTLRGLVVIDPRHMIHNDLVPPVAMEDVLVDNVPMPAGRDLVIAPGKDKVEIHYTALSLLIPDRVRFKYKLEGYDSAWVDAGPRRVAYYTNLSPGSYRFRVIAANDDGVWNEQGASVGFVMKPHFYQTGWFKVLCALLAIAVALAVLRFNTRRLRNRAQELSRLVEERTAELRQSTVELRESQRHLEEVAFLDSLTLLPNRRMFTLELRKMMAVTERREGSFSLLMIDLDQFKQTNDTRGHDAGDALLVESAHRLRAAVRETDCVSRLGGDEFAILLADDQQSIDEICQRIVENFVPHAPYNGAELRTTPSIGIAIYPEDGMTQETLCKSADLALYEVKRAGGNGWQRLSSGNRTLDALLK